MEQQRWLLNDMETQNWAKRLQKYVHVTNTKLRHILKSVTAPWIFHRDLAELKISADDLEFLVMCLS